MIIMQEHVRPYRLELMETGVVSRYTRLVCQKHYMSLLVSIHQEPNEPISQRHSSEVSTGYDQRHTSEVGQRNSEACVARFLGQRISEACIAGFGPENF